MNEAIRPVEVMMMREPGVIGFDAQERPALQPGQVRVQTLYSGISAGTELTIYRGTYPFASKRWNADLMLFSPATETFTVYPTAPGYEEVGRVVEVGSDAEGVQVGDVVFGTWAHKTENVMPARVAVRNRLAPGQEARHGVFSRIGAIALNGILDAQINVGETVAVFGAGVVGLICMGLARLSGATVLACDINPSRLAHAARYSDTQISADMAQAVKEATNGRGADVVIEASGSVPALSEAIRSVAYAGKVVSLGFYQRNGEALMLGEEFHHNRVSIVCSQIFATLPALAYRWDVLRLERTVMNLQASGKLDLLPLITQEIPFHDAQSAYELLDKRPDEAVQVILTFS